LPPRGRRKQQPNPIEQFIEDNPWIFTRIRKEVVRESVKTGFVMAATVFGLWSLANGVIGLLGLGWEAWLAVGTALTALGLLMVGRILR